MVDDRPEAARRMLLKIGHGHLTAQNERNGPGEQPKHYQKPAKGLKVAGEPIKCEGLCDVTSEQAEELLQSVLGKGESRNYPEQGQGYRLPRT
jgi:hypothetical protein